MSVRVIVQFEEAEVEMLDRAVDRLNQKPGERATRSDVVRVGALRHATEVLGLTGPLTAEATQKAAAGGGE